MDALLTKTGARYALVFDRRLPYPPEKVWRVLTEPELLRQWFPCEIVGEWKVGAPLRFNFLHGEGDGLSEQELLGEVLTVEVPVHLEFRWGSNFYSCKLIAEEGGCRLVFSESFEDSSLAARNAAGWEMCLENLDLLLAETAAAPFVMDVWQGKFNRYAKKFETEVGPQQGLPEDYPASE